MVINFCTMTITVKTLRWCVKMTYHFLAANFPYRCCGTSNQCPFYLWRTEMCTLEHPGANWGSTKLSLVCHLVFNGRLVSRGLTSIVREARDQNNQFRSFLSCPGDLITCTRTVRIWPPYSKEMNSRGQIRLTNQSLQSAWFHMEFRN